MTKLNDRGYSFLGSFKLFIDQFQNAEMKKLNGYRPTHKNKWLFIKHGFLTHQELMLLEFYADIVDFDQKHEGFGTFVTDFREMEKIFRMSDSSLRNWHNKLLGLGFIKTTGKQSRYKLACVKRYIEPSWGGEPNKFASAEVDQSVGFLLQQFGIDTQAIGHKVQPVGNKRNDLALNSNSRYLRSSKGNSPAYSEGNVNVKELGSLSKEGYQQMQQENFDSQLESDDMGW